MSETLERMLPLYEGKMGHQYDHRAASFRGVGDTDIRSNDDHSRDAQVMPRYWVRESVADDRAERRDWGSRTALLGFRRVARNTDERTVISASLPFGAASYGWILTAGPDARGLALLLPQYNSFVFDFVLRQFLSQPSIPQGTFEQVPALPLEAIEDRGAWLGAPLEWIVRRTAGLSLTSEDLAEHAEELRLPLAEWDEGLREMIRAEIDAAMFHLYGIERDDVDYIMETFPIVRRKEKAAHGEYRTKRLILEIYDQMAEAMTSGTTYASPIDEEL